MRNLYIGIIVVLILAVGMFVFVQNNSDEAENSSNDSTSQDSTNNNSNDSEGEEAVAAETVTITYTDSGFSPSETTLKVGGTITWVNQSSSELQIGVDPHPSHAGDKSITNEQFVLSLQNGEEETVTVNKTGIFGFHNHLVSSDTGSITVK